MVQKKKKDSDTESGEEKETLYESEQDREHLNSLPEVERERILNERFNQREQRKEREKMLNESMRAGNSRADEKFSKKRDVKPDNEGRPTKRPKFEEPQYNHRAETGITLEDIEKIRISRDQLVKWCNHLYFEKTVIGAFVRINIGITRNTKENIYLMCEVIDVTSSEKYYEIEGNKIKTNKMLVINFGKTKKYMKFDIVSNTVFTQTEFDAYMKRLTKDEMKPVTKYHVQTKIQDIQSAINYKYTREEIDQLVQRELKENLKKGKIEATATLELEKLKVQLEDLKNSDSGVIRSDERKEKIRNLEILIKEVENAIQFDDKIVESDIVVKLNERNRHKQLEIEQKRAEEKRRQKTMSNELPEIKPSNFYTELSQYELDQLAKKNLLQLHASALEIDQSVLSHLKTPSKELPTLVFPHPDFQFKEPAPCLKDPIPFEDWIQNYKPL